jgi:hypothetical protein
MRMAAGSIVEDLDVTKYELQRVERGPRRSARRHGAQLWPPPRMAADEHWINQEDIGRALDRSRAETSANEQPSRTL